MFAGVESVQIRASLKSNSADRRPRKESFSLFPRYRTGKTHSSRNDLFFVFTINFFTHTCTCKALEDTNNFDSISRTKPKRCGEKGQDDSFHILATFKSNLFSLSQSENADGGG